MDKNRSKIIFGKLKVPTPEGNIVDKKLKLLINNSEKSNFTFLEFHLSYQDMKLDLASGIDVEIKLY